MVFSKSFFLADNPPANYTPLTHLLMVFLHMSRTMFQAMNETLQKTVLLVDDDEDLLEGMRLTFEDAGWQVTTHNGLPQDQDIWEFLLHHSADVLVLDVFLPCSHGGSLAEQLHREKPNQKIILISAAGQLNTLCNQANIRHSLAKPFRFEQLLSLAERISLQPEPVEQRVTLPLFQREPLAYSQNRAQTE